MLLLPISLIFLCFFAPFTNAAGLKKSDVSSNSKANKLTLLKIVKNQQQQVSNPSGCSKYFTEDDYKDQENSKKDSSNQNEHHMNEEPENDEQDSGPCNPRDKNEDTTDNHHRHHHHENDSNEDEENDESSSDDDEEKNSNPCNLINDEDYYKNNNNNNEDTENDKTIDDEIFEKYEHHKEKCVHPAYNWEMLVEKMHEFQLATIKDIDLGFYKLFIEYKRLNASIVMFSKSTCSYCLKAKKILNKYNVPFEAVELDNRANCLYGDCDGLKTALENLTGRMTVPQIFINDWFIGGSDELEKLDRNNELDDIIMNKKENFKSLKKFTLNEKLLYPAFIMFNMLDSNPPYTILYTKNDCTACDKAKAILQDNGINFRTVRVDDPNSCPRRNCEKLQEYLMDKHVFPKAKSFPQVHTQCDTYGLADLELMKSKGVNALETLKKYECECKKKRA